LPSETRYRDQTFLEKDGYYTLKQRIVGNNWQVDVFPSDFIFEGRELTISENHPGFFRNKKYVQQAIKDGKTDTPLFKMIAGQDQGGPFTNLKHEYWMSHPDIFASGNSLSGNTLRTYSGPYVPFTRDGSATSTWWPTSTSFSDSLLRAAGSTAIARCAPLSPQVSVAAMLGELRNDGLPLIPSKKLIQDVFQRKGHLLSNTGGEFLNWKFGLDPTIKDLRKLASVVRRSSELIAQMKRDSGRLIRRTYGFPTVRTKVETTLSTKAFGLPSLVQDFYTTTGGVLTKTRETETSIWFSGCFSYLLDPGDSAVERAIHDLRIAQALYGVGITPDVVWQLTPWSWAIDWFTNIGDVVQNVSAWATSGQTMRWGYVMRKETISDTYTLSGVDFKSGPAGPFIQKFTTISKRRLKASPYGFSIQWDGLTPMQLAITAALGISKSGL
jgi:hypothetical protein